LAKFGISTGRADEEEEEEEEGEEEEEEEEEEAEELGTYRRAWDGNWAEQDRMNPLIVTLRDQAGFWVIAVIYGWISSNYFLLQSCRQGWS
jgi:hypothetical protein